MKNCIMRWKNDSIDLAINDQRRAFSDAYRNEILQKVTFILSFLPKILSVNWTRWKNE